MNKISFNVIIEHDEMNADNIQQELFNRTKNFIEDDFDHTFAKGRKFKVNISSSYDQIKKNFIEKFMNTNFRYSTVTIKKAIIDKMQYVFPFEFDYNEDLSKVWLNLGDGITIEFNFTWEQRMHTNGRPTYCLTKIS
jgi:hypothetical protein